MRLVVTPENIDVLEQVAQADAGSVELELRFGDAGPAKVDEVLQKIQKCGGCFKKLELRLELFGDEWPDLSGQSWEKSFPNLRVLSLSSTRIGDELLSHPQLRSLRLRNCAFISNRSLQLGTGEKASALRSIDISESAFLPEGFAFGAGSSVEIFRCFVDEDDAEQPPDRFVFRDTACLREVDIRVCGGWEVEFCGSLPALAHVALSAGSYGDYELANRCSAGSSAYALGLTSEAELAED